MQWGKAWNRIGEVEGGVRISHYRPNELLGGTRDWHSCFIERTRAGDV